MNFIGSFTNQCANRVSFGSGLQRHAVFFVLCTVRISHRYAKTPAQRDYPSSHSSSVLSLINLSSGGLTCLFLVLLFFVCGLSRSQTLDGCDNLLQHRRSSGTTLPPFISPTKLLSASRPDPTASRCPDPIFEFLILLWLW